MWGVWRGMRVWRFRWFGGRAGGGRLGRWFRRILRLGGIIQRWCFRGVRARGGGGWGGRGLGILMERALGICGLGVVTDGVPHVRALAERVGVSERWRTAVERA